MLLGLTLAETEKSIDLHKVSRGSGLTIQIQTWEKIETLREFEMNKSRQYLQAPSRDIWLSHLRCPHIWTTLDVKASCSRPPHKYQVSEI